MNSIYSMYSIRYHNVIKEFNSGYWDLKYLNLKNENTLDIMPGSTFCSKTILYVDLSWASVNVKAIPRLTVQHKFIEVPPDYNMESKMLLTAKRAIR